jgi:serpin B
MAPNSVGGKHVMNAQTPHSSPSPAAAQPAIAAEAVNSFGLKLLGETAGHGKTQNVFVSPLSVFFALAMTESGAAGQTRADMRMALSVPATVGEDALHESASALLKSLQAQTGVRLSIANALWSDARLPLAPGFVERCRNFYQAEATSLDLSSPGAADTINAWVKKKTEDKIPTIVSPENLRGSPAVLTNAVYFKGGWEYKFDKKETKEGDFHLGNGHAGHEGKIKKVVFMHRGSIPRGYRSGPGYEAAALPYDSSDIVLYAILPAPGKTPEEALAKISLPSLRSASPPVDLDLKLPKFTLDFAAELNSQLEKMGMASAFRGGADFVPMGSPKFYIGQVLHKTRLEVDEEGTVAAAATAVVMRATAAMRAPEKKVLVFDRPFALLLCDNRTGAILFAGVIYEPQST